MKTQKLTGESPLAEGRTTKDPTTMGPSVKGLIGSLTEAEWLFLKTTERAELSALDEDALVELHTRVRRARTKYVK